MTRIFLARHGQSEWNRQRRITGQLDPALSAKGMRQAESLAEALSTVALSAIYTSTLTRARDTARPTALAHRLTPVALAALQEMHLGVLQGRFRDERDPEAQRLWCERAARGGDFRVPGGETFADLALRVRPCLEGIVARERGNVVLIVGHRNVNRVILGALMRWPRGLALAARPKSGVLYEITLGLTPSARTLLLAGETALRP